MGGTANCPVCGTSITVPHAATDPCYQTDRLTAYDPALQQLASSLFARVQAGVGPGFAQLTPNHGSYSILAASGSQERAGKIVIIENGIGRRRGNFPNLRDGVYIWVRANAAAAGCIWVADMVDRVFPQFFNLMDPATTLGVARPCNERFTYFRVNLPTTAQLQHAYEEQIVLLLQSCCQIC